MLSILMVILPIFALIFVGWITRRAGLFGPNATSELNRFVVYLGLPALLFDVIAHARWSDVWQPGFIAAFGLSVIVVFAVTLALRGRGRLADAVLDGLAAGYANVGFMGFPLAAAVLGPAALAATTLANIITVCALFAVAIVLIELGLQTQAKGLALARKAALAVAKNPLVIAPVLGALFAVLHLPIPDPAEKALKMVGAAAPPCALVAIGLFLGAPRAAPAKGAGAGQIRTAAILTGLKLVLQPAIALICAKLFHLPPMMARSAVLLAALPTGTGPFMLAEFYRREARTTSDVILASTLGSLVTVSGFLALAG